MTLHHFWDDNYFQGKFREIKFYPEKSMNLCYEILFAWEKYAFML